MVFFPILAQAQYEDYASYETFSELDRYQRDYGLVFLPSLIWMDIQEDNRINGTTVGDRGRNLLLYDVRLGYIFRGGFYFGILYSGDSVDVDTNSPKIQRESLGASFGYIYRGWAMTATWFPYSEQTLGGSNTNNVGRFSKGMGFQLDAAYYYRLNEYISLGPQLVYKNFQYSEAVSSATNIHADADSNHSVLTPMLTFMFNIYRG